MATTIIENVVADGQWAERTVVHHGASESYEVSSYKVSYATPSSDKGNKLTRMFKHVTPRGIT